MSGIPTLLHHRLPRLSLAGMALLLGSCLSYKAKPLNPVHTAADYESRTLNDAGLHAFINRHAEKMGVHGGEWNLGRLTLAALYFHPDLELANAERKAAEAGRTTAAERPNPTVALTPGYDTSAHGISPWIPMVSVDVPIETNGKRGIRKEGAARKAEAARWKMLETAWTVRSKLRKAMLALHGAQRTEALLSAQQTLQADTAKLLDEKRKAGEATPFEATQARIALSQTQLLLHDAQRQVSSSRVQLAEAVGVPSKALDSVKLDFGEFEKSPPDLGTASARRRALTNRADILGALAEYAASDSALRLEIAKQFPDIHLAPGYQLDQTDNKWTVGITFELPVLNQNRGKIREAEAARDVAAAKFRQVQAHALAEIDVAVVNYRGALEKTAAARGLLGETQQQEKSAQKMKEAGAIGKFEVAQRQLEASVSSIALLDAELRAQEALGALEDALQSPATLPESVVFHQPRKS